MEQRIYRRKKLEKPVNIASTRKVRKKKVTETVLISSCNWNRTRVQFVMTVIVKMTIQRVNNFLTVKLVTG
jgi:hypothetical protein